MTKPVIFTEPPVTGLGKPGDVAGMIAGNRTAFYYTIADYNGNDIIWMQTPSLQPQKVIPVSPPAPTIVSFSSSTDGATLWRPVFIGTSLSTNTDVAICINNQIVGHAVVVGKTWKFLMPYDLDIACSVTAVASVTGSTGTVSVPFAYPGSPADSPSISFNMTSTRNPNMDYRDDITIVVNWIAKNTTTLLLDGIPGPVTGQKIFQTSTKDYGPLHSFTLQNAKYNRSVLLDLKANKSNSK